MLRHRPDAGGDSVRPGASTRPTGGMVQNGSACRSNWHRADPSNDPNTLISPPGNDLGKNVTASGADHSSQSPRANTAVARPRRAACVLLAGWEGRGGPVSKTEVQDEVLYVVRRAWMSARGS
jgi:hypothetical protein